jgi:alginate O-acetyltransferase complex protein AlgJ
MPKVNHEGDLLKFVNLGVWDFLLPVRDEVITAVKATLVNTSVEDFMADNSAASTSQETVLVGTSYSANMLWSLEPALKLVLQRDIANKSEWGKGFVIPMQTFLKTLSEKNKAPEIVIWEIPIRFFAEKMPP